MREIKLFTYPTYTVETQSYTGGNQGWFEKTALKNYGCGLVAAADLLLFLSGKTCDIGEYVTFAASLEKTYTKVLRYIGVNGFSLARGINRYAKKHHLKISARWGVKRACLAPIIQEMLVHNIPVILGIGRDLRWGIRQRGVCFYKGNMQNARVHVQGHYVTVTGIMAEDGECQGGSFVLSIASWGEEFLVDFDELCNYMDSQPLGIRYLLSNILYIEEMVWD